MRWRWCQTVVVALDTSKRMEWHLNVHRNQREHERTKGMIKCPSILQYTDNETWSTECSNGFHLNPFIPTLILCLFRSVCQFRARASVWVCTVQFQPENAHALFTLAIENRQYTELARWRRCRHKITIDIFRVCLFNCCAIPFPHEHAPFEMLSWQFFHPCHTIFFLFHPPAELHNIDLKCVQRIVVANTNS